MYLDTAAGQYAIRHEVTRDLSLLMAGMLGGDLGGTYSHFWESPPIQHNGARISLKGRTLLTSPAAYRVNLQISVDGSEYQNFGSMFYTKELSAEPRAMPNRP
jgi:hypothetical protein